MGQRGYVLGINWRGACGARVGGLRRAAGGGHSRFLDVDIRRRSPDPELLVVVHGVYRATVRASGAAEFGSSAGDWPETENSERRKSDIHSITRPRAPLSARAP